MVERGDGVLRLPMQAIELGRVLVERANAFIAEHPQFRGQRFAASSRSSSRPCARTASRRGGARSRSEFSEEEWRLVSELADHPNRLLVTGNARRAARPMRRWRTRRSSGAGTSCATGSRPSASSWPGEAGSKPRAAPGRRHRPVEERRAAHGLCARTGAKLARGGAPADIPEVDRSSSCRAARPAQRRRLRDAGARRRAGRRHGRRSRCLAERTMA